MPPRQVKHDSGAHSLERHISKYLFSTWTKLEMSLHTKNIFRLAVLILTAVAACGSVGLIFPFWTVYRPVT